MILDICMAERHDYFHVPRSKDEVMRKAIILSLTEDTTEMESLLATLDISVIEVVVQKKNHPHTVSYLGPGKIEDLEKEIDDTEANLLIVNGTLKPSQHHYLEMKFQMECMDRVGVILQIFTEHAHTPEAIAQVKLARFRYELPFLREWIHKAKSGDRPGFLAGGAYATDVYYEYARKQMNRIEKYLDRVSKERELTRAKRKARGYTLVCLSGYTNAGKSSLLNAVCGSKVEVDGRMFSTLATTTRKVPGLRENVLMTDTVGFIKDLPPDLVEAFKSTLEEIFQADVILLVFDASESEENLMLKLRASLSILLPEIGDRTLIGVGSKVDAITRGSRKAVEEVAAGILESHELLFVSARTGEGLDHLKRAVTSSLGFTQVITARLPVTDESYSLISRLHARAVIESRIKDEALLVTIVCKSEDQDRVIGWLAPLAAGSIRVETRGTKERGETPARGSSGNAGAPL